MSAHADSSLVPECEFTEDIGEREREFWKFHGDNPKVWEQFERFCLEMIEAGQIGFGAPFIWERVRWEGRVRTRAEDPYRLPNIHRPFYARLFQARHPDLADKIATRPLRG